MYQNLLIPTDGSELSQKAVESGLTLAALCNASVVVLKVVPRYPHDYFEGGLTREADIQQQEKHWSDAAQAMVNTIKAEGAERGVNITTAVVKSDMVAESIIVAAKKHECDLIVMASHGRRGVKRLLLGSETQHVLTDSHIPGLVLR